MPNNIFVIDFVVILLSDITTKLKKQKSPQSVKTLLAPITFTLILAKHYAVTQPVNFALILSISRSLCTVTQRDGVIYLSPMSFSQ